MVGELHAVSVSVRFETSTYKDKAEITSGPPKQFVLNWKLKQSTNLGNIFHISSKHRH